MLHFNTFLRSQLSNNTIYLHNETADDQVNVEHVEVMKEARKRAEALLLASQMRIKKREMQAKVVEHCSQNSSS